jgi:hypothetical protein
MCPKARRARAERQNAAPLAERGERMAEEREFEVIYTNLVRITHVALEFLIDFKRLGPENREVESAPTQVRVVMHPVIAKAFRDALAENVRRYEQQFGEIPPPSGGAAVVH